MLYSKATKPINVTTAFSVLNKGFYNNLTYFILVALTIPNERQEQTSAAHGHQRKLNSILGLLSS